MVFKKKYTTIIRTSNQFGSFGFLIFKINFFCFQVLCRICFVNKNECTGQRLKQKIFMLDVDWVHIYQVYEGFSKLKVGLLIEIKNNFVWEVNFDSDSLSHSQKFRFTISNLN